MAAVSAEAVGWVYRHSPFKGATFQVHHAVADSVNDQNGNRFWMKAGKLATKSRVSRQRTTEALHELAVAGYLRRVTPKGNPGRSGSVEYEFLFPDAPVFYDSRPKSVTEGDTKVSPEATSPVAVDDKQETQSEPKEEPKRRARARNPLFDALVLAFGDASTSTRASFYGKCVRELKDIDATPEQVIQARAEMTKRGWSEPSPNAMLKHWDDLLRTVRPSAPGEGMADRMSRSAR